MELLYELGNTQLFLPHKYGASVFDENFEIFLKTNKTRSHDDPIIVTQKVSDNDDDSFC